MLESIEKKPQSEITICQKFLSTTITMIALLISVTDASAADHVPRNMARQGRGSHAWYRSPSNTPSTQQQQEYPQQYQLQGYQQQKEYSHQYRQSQLRAPISAAESGRQAATVFQTWNPQNCRDMEDFQWKFHNHGLEGNHPCQQFLRR
jgi:hypothetical protein